MSSAGPGDRLSEPSQAPVDGENRTRDRTRGESVSPSLRPRRSLAVRADGGTFVLQSGQVVVDLVSQTMNMHLGQAQPRVLAAAEAQGRRLQFASSTFGSSAFLELSDRLAGMVPGLDTVLLKLTNGSDAVETAIKMARLHTRRRGVACLPQAWHGESYLALGLATTHRRRLLAADLPVHNPPRPTIDALAVLVESRRDLAAAIVDPILLSNGLSAIGIDATFAALRRLRNACDTAGTVLVLDEIQSFGGWVEGHAFASTAAGVTADIVCLGKALGAGYPLAAVVCRPEFGELLQYNDAEFTHGGHPVSCAAALAGLDVLAEIRAGLPGRSRRFGDLLESVFDPGRFQVRRAGLVATITVGDSDRHEVWARRTVEQCLDDGMFVRTVDLGRRLLLKPPHTLPWDDLCVAVTAVAAVASRARHGLDRARAAADARAGLREQELSGRLLRKRPRPNPNNGYVSALLAAHGMGVTAHSRSAVEQASLASRLRACGVPAAPVYPAGDEVVEYEYIPGRVLQAVLVDPRTSDAVVNGLAMRHYEAVVTAHDNGHVIGDRWPGNTIVTPRYDLVLIDFELGYYGPWHETALFEEVFTVVQTLVAVPSGAAARLQLGRRLWEAVVDRHGRPRVRRTMAGLARFYLDPARPVHEESTPAQAYAAVLDVDLTVCQQPAAPGSTDELIRVSVSTGAA